ncbi:MAG: TatD family hydrolase [Burkholderia sp.]|nr:TatD family hydrolase [Burkholderia sp.]
MFVDSHCHLNFKSLSDRLPNVLENMHKHYVTHALCVSINLETLPDVLSIAAAHDNIYASVGVHPKHNVDNEPTCEELAKLAAYSNVIAIGETGLDYYQLDSQSIIDMNWQRDRFRKHIRVAREIGKPLIIHTRAAIEDTLKIMSEEHADEVGGIMHCFSEPWPVALRSIEQNFYISLSGIVTFKSATQIHDVARRIPLDRLLIETDSPYLAPVPYRGKLNEPAYVSYIGRFIAKQRGISEIVLAEATTYNFFRLFNLSR